MGLGKTSFISILSKIIKVKKILVIDLDILNNSLHSVYGVNNIPYKMKEKLKDEEYLYEFRLREKNIEKLIMKVNNNIDLISNVKYIFDEHYICNNTGIENMIKGLKEKYDLILIDTTQDFRYREIMKILMKISDKIICLLEGNLICMEKTMELLNKNIKQKDKINIIYNKRSKYTIGDNVLKMIFFKFKIIGTLSYDCKYDKIINKNVNKLYISSTIEKEFNKIIKKLA